MSNFFCTLLIPKTDLAQTELSGWTLARFALAIRLGCENGIFRALNDIKAGRTPRRNVDYLRALYFLNKRQTLGAVESLKEELRYFPDNTKASALLKKLQSADTESAGFEPEFRELLAAVRPSTMLSDVRLHSLYKLAMEVCAKDLPGDFVECGVAAGGSSALLATIISRHSRRPRRLFSCDTFSGMPEPSAEDRHAGEQAMETGWGTGTCAAPVDSLKELCRKLGVESIVQPVVGLFSDTLPSLAGDVSGIALLHMDGDWYSSTKDILTNLFDKVSPGAPVQVDDYGFWDGCRKAMNEFAAARAYQFQLTTIDKTGVFFYR